MSAARSGARVFVGLSLGAELGPRLAARCAAVLPARGFRLARGEGLHLTLFFLGEVGRGALAGIAAALRSELASQPALALRLDGTGAFPGPTRARVLWVGVEERAHPGRLAACRLAVLEGLARAGIDTHEERERSFQPHVTVARPRAHARLPAEFGGLALALDWDPDGVELLESRLGPEGSRYECLERFPFSQGE